MAGRLAGFLMLLGLAAQGQWLRTHKPPARRRRPRLCFLLTASLSAGPAPTHAGKMKVVEEPNTFG